MQLNFVSFEWVNRKAKYIEVFGQCNEISFFSNLRGQQLAQFTHQSLALKTFTYFVQESITGLNSLVSLTTYKLHIFLY